MGIVLLRRRGGIEVCIFLVFLLYSITVNVGLDLCEETKTDVCTCETGEASGIARAQGSGYAAANAEQREVKAKRVDHLGIEG